MGLVPRTVLPAGAATKADAVVDLEAQKALLPVSSNANEDHRSSGKRPPSASKPMEGACKKPFRSSGRVLFLVCMFCAMSSMLLIINKGAMVKYPFPNAVLCFQLGSSALVAHSIELVKREKSSLTWGNLMASLPISVSFFLGVSTSMNALKHVNVDTMVVVKTCTPILVAVAEWMFRDYALPSRRTWASLAAVVVTTSAAFSLHLTDLTATGAAWILAWLVVVVFNLVYSSHYVATVNLTANGRVLCENLIAAALSGLPMLLWEARDPKIITGLAGYGGWLVLLSCVVGFGMSWFGWSLREEVTALTYSVIGVVNKLITVIANHLVWARHGPLSSSVLLALGITTAALYKQPPKLSESAAAARSRSHRTGMAMASVVAVISMVTLGLKLGSALRHVGPTAGVHMAGGALIHIQPAHPAA